MTQDEFTQILDCMEKPGPKGMSLASLAGESGIDIQSLKKYLAQFPDYFVQLPESRRYKVNRFGRFKGDVSRMLKNHEKTLQTKRSSYFLLYFMLLVAAMTSITAAVSTAT